MNQIRTRFAPSPTGFQHVGGFRTAMYAWLWAKKNNGQFILRVEDTDQDRRVEGAIKYIVDSLHGLGLDYDEGPSKADLKALGEDSEFAPEKAGDYGPYIQSMRLDIYQKAAERLVSEGKAYRCDCTSERLEQERLEQMARREKPGYSGYCRTRNVAADTKSVIRLRLPDQIKLTLDDAVRGKVVWDDPPLRDPVILKSDGFPTYHLASVVDDNEMKISHIFRGEEWLPTTPIHLLLYEAFGWEKPVFVHLSHILGPDGKKLSKRHGAEAVNQYAEKGILSEALLNYVTLIGWSPGEGDDQEVFTREELIKKFSLEGLNTSGGVFDNKKLEWMNGVYLRNLSEKDFSDIALPLIKASGGEITKEAWSLIVKDLQERVKTTLEIVPMVEFLWLEKLEREMDSIFKGPVDKEMALNIFKQAHQKLFDLDSFVPDQIESNLKSIVDDLGLKMGQVFVPIRIAVTGKKATPPLFESIAALGKDKTLKRLEEIQNEISSAN